MILMAQGLPLPKRTTNPPSRHETSIGFESCTRELFINHDRHRLPKTILEAVCEDSLECVPVYELRVVKSRENRREPYHLRAENVVTSCIRVANPDYSSTDTASSTPRFMNIHSKEESSTEGGPVQNGRQWVQGENQEELARSGNRDNQERQWVQVENQEYLTTEGGFGHSGRQWIQGENQEEMTTKRDLENQGRQWVRVENQEYVSTEGGLGHQRRSWEQGENQEDLTSKGVVDDQERDWVRVANQEDFTTEPEHGHHGRNWEQAENQDEVTSKRDLSHQEREWSPVENEEVVTTEVERNHERRNWEQRENQEDLTSEGDVAHHERQWVARENQEEPSTELENDGRQFMHVDNLETGSVKTTQSGERLSRSARSSGSSQNWQYRGRYQPDFTSESSRIARDPSMLEGRMRYEGGKGDDSLSLAGRRKFSDGVTLFGRRQYQP